MRFHFPIIIIDEDFRSENASGLGIRALADGHLGLPDAGPFDSIVAAASGEALPRAWLEQLAVGGRLVAPTVTPAGHQALVVILRTDQGFERQVLESVHFVPLKSGVA